MPRRQVKRGGRKFQPEKPLIYVFCEGESEQAYAKFLKEHFADVAVLKIPSKTGLFSKAKNDFDKEPKYRNYAEVTDEIWFFFDVEADDCGKWDERWKIIETLRGLREKPNVHVRLLMTTACIEYWLMLHAERHPQYAIRISKRGYRKDGAITNIPLYLVRKTKELL
mgnify:CR=1 FL=1